MIKTIMDMIMGKKIRDKTKYMILVKVKNQLEMDAVHLKVKGLKKLQERESQPIFQVKSTGMNKK